MKSSSDEKRSEAARDGDQLGPTACTSRDFIMRKSAILPMVNHLIIKELVLSDYANPNNLQTVINRVLESGVKAIVIKMVAGSGLSIDPSSEVFNPAFKHERHTVGETTVTGDGFHTGLLFARHNLRHVFKRWSLGSLYPCRSIASTHAIRGVCLPKDDEHSWHNLFWIA